MNAESITSEVTVVGSDFSVLSTVDLRGVPASCTSARAIVVATRGMPFVGEVAIDILPGGRGPARRRGWVCPRCAVAKFKLLTDGRGGVGCADCLERRTRRANERTCALWTRLGGELEDRILRALRAPRRSSSVPPSLLDSVGRLAADDEHRCASMVSKAGAVLQAVRPPRAATVRPEGRP